MASAVRGDCAIRLLYSWASSSFRPSRTSASTTMRRACPGSSGAGAGVDGARVLEAPHAEERLALPEARLLGLARRRPEALGPAEGLERRVEGAEGEPCLAEEQRGLRRARVGRGAPEKPPQHR